MRPVRPARNDGRQEHRHQHQGDADDRRRTARSIALIAASWPFMPCSMLCAAFSTTTMASSTTMPIASTIANSVEHVDGEAERRHRGERADDRDGHGGRRHQHRAPVLEEHQDHDQHQHAGLDQRLVDLVDRLSTNIGGVERRVVFDAFGEVASQAPPSWLLDGLLDLERVGARRLEDADAGGRLAVRARRSGCRSARPVRPEPTSRTRVTSPLVPVLTMMFSNCVGVVEPAR